MNPEELEVGKLYEWQGKRMLYEGSKPGYYWVEHIFSVVKQKGVPEWIVGGQYKHSPSTVQRFVTPIN